MTPRGQSTFSKGRCVKLFLGEKAFECKGSTQSPQALGSLTFGSSSLKNACPKGHANYSGRACRNQGREISPKACLAPKWLYGNLFSSAKYVPDTYTWTLCVQETPIWHASRLGDAQGIPRSESSSPPNKSPHPGTNEYSPPNIAWCCSWGIYCYREV